MEMRYDYMRRSNQICKVQMENGKAHGIVFEPVVDPGRSDKCLLKSVGVCASMLCPHTVRIILHKYSGHWITRTLGDLYLANVLSARAGQALVYHNTLLYMWD